MDSTIEQSWGEARRSIEPAHQLVGKGRESATDQFGPVTIDVVGVFDRTRVTVLEHVDARGSRSLTGAPGPCQRRRPA
jgi:hypothetical protein